jgi:hypothetical protein
MVVKEKLKSKTPHLSYVAISSLHSPHLLNPEELTPPSPQPDPATTHVERNQHRFKYPQHIWAPEILSTCTSAHQTARSSKKIRRNQWRLKTQQIIKKNNILIVLGQIARKLASTHPIDTWIG